jgi:2-methylcitrate dehydratase PrpD
MTTDTPNATRLGAWVADLDPSPADLDLAERSLRDTAAVALAARGDALLPILGALEPAGRWAAAAHVVDFDDLHMESTTHISAVCVAATLAAGGGADDYLAGAGVMARIGVALGWSHYRSGWHITCTAGAPGAAASAAAAMGLSAEETAAAIALSVAAAGGVQRAFGTSAKCLQVGFAAEAGVRAAALVRAGATADPRALDQWLGLMGASGGEIPLGGPAVPGGLAIKVYPCCYALQRPIEATLRIAGNGRPPADVEAVAVRTPASTVQPLIHSRPVTGLEGKFSLEYAVAAALTDGYPGRETFSDAGVGRPELQELLRRVEVDTSDGGTGLLDGEVEIEVRYRDGATAQGRLGDPAGSPGRPPSAADMEGKFLDCAGDRAAEIARLSWAGAGAFLDRELGFSEDPAPAAVEAR